MRTRFLAGLVCGIMLGVGGTLATFRLTATPAPILSQPLTLQPLPPARPAAPPNATRQEFNGSYYYLIPLSADT